MTNPFDLKDKVVCVTGASSGIGQQCAITCSKFGAKVILIARNEERLLETLSKMDRKEDHVILSVDLTDYKNVENKIKKAVDIIGLISGLINCAGKSVTLPLKFNTIEKLKDYFDVNVYSSYNLTRIISKKEYFSPQGGSIIFMSSIMGHVGDVGKSLYGMTKGALLSGTKSLACELAKRKIRVNTISPGAILTPINQNLPHMSNPENKAILESKHLLGLGETSDVANACVYLLSDASKWVTGIDLCVDGGYMVR